MSKRIVGLAVAVAAVSFTPAPASASHACVGIEKAGTLGPPLSIGGPCQPTPAHLCRTTDLGLHPTLVVLVHVCVPR